MLPPKLEIVNSSSGNNPVYSSVKRYTLEGLSDLIRVMLENVDDAMFERSDKVDNDRERTMYFEAMREIRLKRESLKNSFDHEMRQCFDNFITGNPVASDADAMGELTLLELSVDRADVVPLAALLAQPEHDLNRSQGEVTIRIGGVGRRVRADELPRQVDSLRACPQTEGNDRTDQCDRPAQRLVPDSR